MTNLIALSWLRVAKGGACALFLDLLSPVVHRQIPRSEACSIDVVIAELHDDYGPVLLCEKLSAVIPAFKYDLKIFPRDLHDSEGKRTVLSLHPSGTAPTIVDTLVSPPVTISKSQAILQYILEMYGQGHFQMTPKAGVNLYANYLYWMSFANASFQANLVALLTGGGVIQSYGLDPVEAVQKAFVMKYFQEKVTNHLEQYEGQLSKTRYLAGDEFSAVDFMNIYGLTTFRAMYPVDISAYSTFLRYLRKITLRPGYRRMMDKAEEGMPALIQGKVPQFPMEVLGSVKSWKTVLGENGEKLDAVNQGG